MPPQLYKIVLTLLTKLFPLLKEILLKDRTVGEFVRDNQLASLLFVLLLVVSASNIHQTYQKQKLLAIVNQEVYRPPTPPPPPTEPVKPAVGPIPKEPTHKPKSTPPQVNDPPKPKKGRKIRRLITENLR